VPQKRYDSLLEFCRLHPNILYVDELIGGADFEFEAICESNEKFREILANVRHNFSDIIRGSEVLLYIKEYKLVWFPESA